MAMAPVSMQGSFRQIPGNLAQCSLSLQLVQTLILYSAISGTFLTLVLPAVQR